MRRSLRSVAAVFATLAATSAVARLASSCVDFDSLGNGRLDGASPEAEASAPAEAGPADPCEHLRPVDPPDADDAPDASLPKFELAIDQAILDPTRARGYDLDGVCTCDPRPGAPNDGGPTCASSTVVCDFEGGVDNALGLVAQTAAPGTQLDIVPNRLIAAGTRTLLVQLAEYDGLADDARVVVGLFLAEGIRDQGCDASTFDPGKGTWSPGKCGDDPWSLSPSSAVVAGSLILPLVVGTGYVRDFKLVVRFGKPVTVPVTESRTIPFSDAVLTADIVPLGQDLQPRDRTRPPTQAEQRLYRMEGGVIAGRLPVSDVLYAVGSYPTLGTKLCTTAAFDAVRTQLCGAADITNDPTASANAACDALSSAFGFVAVPARAANLYDGGPPSDECAQIDAGAFRCP